jgi:protein-L-isoaspartate(D-aspartate) O-methyltransferase
VSGSDFAYARDRMVRRLETGGVVEPRVLEAMRQVPRHLFVPEHVRSQAYADHALPIGGGQTISHPYVVARMTELAEIEAEHSVLEVGTGSGYQTAVLAHLARRVFSLERVAALAREAIRRLRDLGFDNVKIQAFDGTVGWTQMAPFDRIVVTAGAPQAPQPLLDQLSPRGLLVVPEGDREKQRLVVYRRLGRGMRRKVGQEVAFVPLIGRHGWRSE